MNPYRFRESMNADELLNCDFQECFYTERKIKEALNRHER